MNSDFLFKKPIGGYSVEDHLELIQQDIMKDDWNSVETEVKNMEQYLDKKVYPFVQFSDERENINNMKRNLKIIKAGIKAKDKPQTLISFQSIKWDWDDLGK